MYDTLLLDRTAWDLVLDSNSNIALASPPYSLAQDVATAQRTVVGDNYYSQTDGIPYFNLDQGSIPPVSLMQAYLRKQALTVLGVVQIIVRITGFIGRKLTGQTLFTDEDGNVNVSNF
jgi:hypothetical protein